MAAPRGRFWLILWLGFALGVLAWVNARQVWGVGTGNFATGKIHIDAYMQ